MTIHINGDAGETLTVKLQNRLATNSVDKISGMFARMLEVQYRRGEITLEEIYEIVTGNTGPIPENVTFSDLPQR